MNTNPPADMRGMAVRILPLTAEPYQHLSAAKLSIFSEKKPASERIRLAVESSISKCTSRKTSTGRASSSLLVQQSVECANSK